MSHGWYSAGCLCLPGAVVMGSVLIHRVTVPEDMTGSRDGTPALTERSSDGYPVQFQINQEWKDTPYGAESTGVAGCVSTVMALGQDSPVVLVQWAEENCYVEDGLGCSGVSLKWLPRQLVCRHRTCRLIRGRWNMDRTEESDPVSLDCVRRPDT